MIKREIFIKKFETVQIIASMYNTPNFQNTSKKHFMYDLY